MAAFGMLTTGAVAQPQAVVNRLATDGFVVYGYDNPARPKAMMLALVVRVGEIVADVRAGSLPATVDDDSLYVCLGFITAKSTDIGCTLTPGKPVTTGTVEPEGARFTVRVPSMTRRGWIEADLTITAKGSSAPVPVAADHAYTTRDVFGVDVPAYATAYAGTVFVRTATTTGTFRTDRTGKVRPRPMKAPYSDVLLRTDVTTAEAFADDVPVPAIGELRDAVLASLLELPRT